MDTNSADSPALVVERYKYLLQQIHTTNENLYRFLGIFQIVLTALVTAGLTLFVSYRSWSISPEITRLGLRGILVLVTIVASFVILLIFVGVLAWLDYRNEECDLTDEYLAAGFRKRPKRANFYRWYETYVVLLVVIVTVTLWLLAETVLIPQVR